MLEGGIPLTTRLPRPVTLRRLTSADATAFARHVAGDAERLQEHLRSNYVLRDSRLDTDVLALVGSEIDEAAGLRRGASPGV